MPSISTPSKIAGVRLYTPNVIFSGSTAQEREAVLAEVQDKTGALFVPPYNHPDIMLGQGTASLELSSQYAEAKGKAGAQPDVVVAPCGGGGLLSGTATWFNDKPTYVFGAEPSFQGGNDAQRGLAADPPKRVEVVKTLTIADGLRTYVGPYPWSVLTGGSETKAKFVQGVHSVTEEQIKDAMRLVLERLKVFIEPSAAVPLAVVLYDPDFRRWVVQKQKEEKEKSGETRKWDVGIIFSGGNTTIEAILGIFGGEKKEQHEVLRQEGKVGLDGRKEVENVAG
jgi:threonine dehydratase